MRENNTHRIAALLTCYNRREKTLNCLESLLRAFLPDTCQIEVFLVDDGSTDGTSEAVKKSFPQVQVIQGSGNLFWNKGMNLAWRSAVNKAEYDFYLWMNDDVLLEPDFLNNLFNDFEETRKKNSIIVGACRSKKGYVTYSGYKDLNKKQKLEPSGRIQQCDYFNGNVVLIAAEVFEKVGFLDPIFHHGKGDFDYGLRAREKGIKLYVSSVYVGTCELHSDLPKWCNPRYSIFERWENFKKPLGGNPKNEFYNTTQTFWLLDRSFSLFYNIYETSFSNIVDKFKEW